MNRTASSVIAMLLAATAFLLPAAAQPTEEEMMAAWQAAMAVGPEHEALTAREGTWAATTTFAAMPGSSRSGSPAR